MITGELVTGNSSGGFGKGPTEKDPHRGYLAGGLLHSEEGGAGKRHPLSDYGPKKRGVAYNYQGQCCGRPHVATWAETCTALAADLMAGDEDPRGHAADLLRRALAALPAPARAGRVLLRADAGYFAGQLARAAMMAGVEFAIARQAHRPAVADPRWCRRR